MIGGLKDNFVFAEYFLMLLHALTQLERTKIDQFKLPEKLSFTLPLGNLTSLKIAALLTNERNESLLETEHFEVKLPSTHLEETKPAVEHGHTSE